MSEAVSSDTAVAAGPEKKPSKKFPGNFWTINVIEMGERLAYYNLRVVAPIYIMQADNPGGLHLTATDKGIIYAWWAIVQSILPIFTGGLADRWGFKRTLSFAIPAIMLGYMMLGVLRDVDFVTNIAAWFLTENSTHTPQALANYWLFFLSITVLAAGSAFFKPGLQGALANTLTKETSSIGWGLFYWVVNVGSLVAHYIPGFLLVGGSAIFGTEPNSAEAWRNVFLASALFTGFNLVILFTKFEDVPSGASATEPFLSVLKRTFLNLWEPRLLAFLTIMSGFWLMMFQLWDLQPNFIADWLDSSKEATWLQTNFPALAGSLVQETPRGPMIMQNVLLGLNSTFIICGVMLTSWLTRNIRTLSAMMIGMGTATTGVLVAGWTMNLWWLVFGILFFSIGEMTTGPKKSEYLSLIAPPGKKGLYLGYVNIPSGVGILFGSLMAGHVYGNYGEKAILALKYIAQHTPEGMAKNWDGNVKTLEKTLEISRPDAVAKLQEMMGMDAHQVTQLLWDTYSPHMHVWLPFAAIGVISGIALLIFGQMARRWKDMNA